VATAERLDAAVPTEEMVDVVAAELVIGEIVLALEDLEILLSCDRLPEATFGTHRTIATARAFRRIEPAFETHCAAMAAALMELFHRRSPHG
jgi:hypothetical protein